MLRLQDAKRLLTLKIDNVTCPITSPELLKMTECTISELAISRYSFNVFFELQRELKRDGEMRVLLLVKGLKTVRVIKFIDFTMKICDIMASIQRMPLIQKILDEIRRSSNFPLACPLHGNYLYNLTNMIITDAVVPSYAPSNQFNVTLQFFESRKMVAIYQVLGSIKANMKRN
ncbi:uncharacterized protein LOC142239980 [Haematobia irritans]|uniref:uncharacterized protein LOC142239980 n=1 Tax=Haematobia irritans TaxID=7368 RepID=UPI003F50A764